MDYNTLGLIFADGKLMTATEAAAYIKELIEENEKLKTENKHLKDCIDGKK